MDLQSILVVAAIGAGLGLTLLGGSARARRIRAMDPLKDLQRERAQTASSAQGTFDAMELRLFDYGREVEARIDNQLRVLDHLIVEADREIARLEALLAETRYDWPTERVLSRQEQQRCFAMNEAGLSVDEIASCLNTTAAAVTEALAEWRSPGAQAA